MTTGKYGEQLNHTANRIIVFTVNSPFSIYATFHNMIQEVTTVTTKFPKAGGTKY